MGSAAVQIDTASLSSDNSSVTGLLISTSMFLRDPQETGKCKCQGLFLAGNSSLIIDGHLAGKENTGSAQS